MSFALQTPQRAVPGAFLPTPALNRGQSLAPQPSFLRAVSYPTLPGGATQLSGPMSAHSVASPPPASMENLKPLQRAATTINETLVQETRFPELDSYVGQGVSSDYYIPSSKAWAPFVKTKTFDIPEKILEQHNRAQVSTIMGLFAELNHAWIAIDNALYLWDYTHPNPDLIGFEEQSNSITAVKLVTPRPGVFTSQITHLLVVATTAEMILVGLSWLTDAAGNNTVNLYQTRMALAVRGMSVIVIEGSAASGRIFFSNRGDADVYELKYQQEEKWFQSRCGKVNHTARGLSALAPSLSTLAPALTFGQRSTEYIVQMITDDTRSLLYTLSSHSTIRTFHMKPNGGLECMIVQTLSLTFSHIGHMVSRTELLGPGVSIVSISPISATEAQKLHLMATTSTGCRLFMSATASSSWSSTGASNAPTSMRVQHIKFPPPPQGTYSRPRSQQTIQAGPYQGPSVDTQSKALSNTRTAQRFPPGYFFCFTADDKQRSIDTLFLSSPDTGRIARPQDSAQTGAAQFPESSVWVGLESHAEDVGLISRPFVAASSPQGFGNELAIQFDRPPSEIAILTNTGIHTIRRRRLVDIFAAAIQISGRGEGLESEVRKFIRLYGRGETTATALAVACGQGEDVAPDARITKLTNPEILESARKAFIDFGGKPVLNENFMVDRTGPAIDSVRPSPRHEGMALYISRLVRSIWKVPILVQQFTPLRGVIISPTVRTQKLRDIQRDLSSLQDFLTENKSFIDGLAGPESLTRVSTKQEEIALQAEHRALHSLVVLIANIIEGISFVLVLFDERVDEIIMSLSDESRQRIRQLTFEGLFATSEGKELAKELVKAIVNRNIANGSNVDTVAEALRRRCGSFCSADDVVIFKAQELLKKASEAGGNSDMGRRLLNESLRLFQQVAASLTMEQLQWAVQQFISMEFYAGGIQLALSVAKEKDRGNQAWSWINDGRREDDPRREAYVQRTSTYRLIQDVITHVDQASRQAPEMIDGAYTATTKRRTEAYAVIDNSDDEVFQNVLYDWYLENGWHDRLLAVRSTYVVSYLQRKGTQSVEHSDLLWRYFAQRERYHDAAAVQFQLAKSEFQLPLEKRIEYLSMSKANASTFTPGIGKQSRQVLLHEIAESLDVANIQDDLLQRLRQETRLAPERKQAILEHLDGQVLGLSELYNQFADQASYFDICLLIYQAADYRNLADIKATWQNLLDQVNVETLAKGEPQPYEAVAEKVRSLGNRLHLSENTFPISILLPLLKKYAFECQRDIGPDEWVIDTFLDLQVPYDTILPVLESMFYNDEAPFQGRNRRFIANDILYVCKRWYGDSIRGGQPPFGGEENIAAVYQILLVLMENGVDNDKMEECRGLRNRIEQFLR